MDIFGRIVLAACIIGIIDKVVSILCGESYSSQLRLITALVMIISIGTQINGGINMPDMSYYERELEAAENRTKEDYLDSIEDNIAKRLKQIYSNEGIELERVSIAVSYDEYKYISVDEIDIYAKDTEINDEKLRKTASVYFPEAEIIIIR